MTGGWLVRTAQLILFSLEFVSILLKKKCSSATQQIQQV